MLHFAGRALGGGVALGIERRVEVNEVNGFAGDMLAQHVEVVAVVELVHFA